MLFDFSERHTYVIAWLSSSTVYYSFELSIEKSTYNDNRTNAINVLIALAGT